MRYNLIPNPKAALDLASWASYDPTKATLTQVTNFGAEGLPPLTLPSGQQITTCVKLSRTGSGVVVALMMNGAARVAGQLGVPYTFSAYHYRPAVGVGNPSMFEGWDYNDPVAGKVVYFSESEFYTAPGAWVRLAFQIMPLSGGYLYAGGGGMNDATAPNTYWTAVLAEQGNVLLPYFDGDSPGASWLGAANESTSVQSVSTHMRTLADQVQGALLAAIAARSPATTQVSLGYPAGGFGAENIWIPVDFDSTVPWVTSGWTQRGEDSTVEVRIAVKQTTSASTDCRDRALLLAGCVEDAIAADRTLGGIIDGCEVSAIKGQEAIPDEHERQYGVTLAVRWWGDVTA